MANIAKITNISIDNIDKVYEVNKSGVTKVMGVSLSTSGPTTKSYNIDIDHTKVDSNLTNFPLLVNLSNSAGTNSYDVTDIFDTIGSDYNKIKILDSNGQQLYTEVENWDATNKTAQLWVKVPTVSSNTNTQLTLDYSATSGSNDYINNDPTAKAINLNLDINNEGTYDTSQVNTPCVIKDGSTYKMWYTGYDGSHDRILYCTSTDGINWSNFQMVVNIGSEGTYDTTVASDPCVIKDGSTYKMWYRGADSSNNRIIYCTSTDGISWSNFQMVVNYNSQGTYDTYSVHGPSVIKDGSIYKMWYTGNSTYILYCDSTDGINWSNFQLSVNIGSEGTYDTGAAQASSVIKDGSTYKMWYNGSYGFHNSSSCFIYATSTNGISWSNFQKVIDGNIDDDTFGVYMISVIKENSNLYKTWFAASSSTWKILYTTSEDGINWYKNVVNRVWDDDFVAVYHMNQDPSAGANSILDSTKNTNHGTPNGNMTSDDLVDGQVGKALDFDGTDDYINIGNVFDPTYYTLEAIFQTTDTTSNDGITLISSKYDGSYIEAEMSFDGTNAFNFMTGFYVNGTWYRNKTGVKNKNDGIFHYVAGTYDKAHTKSYIDTASYSTAHTKNIHTTTQDYRIGARWNAETYGGWWNGVIDEVRISKTARSADWVKATYHSNWDNLNSWSS